MTSSGQYFGLGLVEKNIHVIVADLADRHERSRDFGNLKSRHDVIGRSACGLQVEVDLTIVRDLVPVSCDKCLSSLAASRGFDNVAKGAPLMANVIG